ncbi:MAG: M20/M25/M40 family metallo-hydrolase [Anaerolineae bacterium]|nr:M20/M25/M40 family metallo-hydrolase [Anaerolineae bacterium]
MIDAVVLLQELVKIPSPNLPGDTRAIAAYIAEVMREAGCMVKMLAPEQKPEAQSVVATFGQGAPVIMLHAHIDTVPIAVNEAQRWSVDPYAAVIQEGKLYGKGSVDDKAPLAAMMAVILEKAHPLPLTPSPLRSEREPENAKPLSQHGNEGEQIEGTLVLVAAAEEETGGVLGTKWLAENGHLPMCDFIVVGEQTHNHVATAHKGVMRATVRATGRSVHATNPDRGVNAITAMAKAVLALDAYHKELATRPHPIVGVPTCNVGVIQGGSTANAVPDSCVVYLDRRMVPGENPAVVQDEMRAVIDGVDAGEATLSIGEFQTSNWFESTAVSALAQTFLGCVEGEFRKTLAPQPPLPHGEGESENPYYPGPIGYLPGSDAKHLTGVTRGEMIIFGPGSYEVAHAFDEYVDVKEFASTVNILRAFVEHTIRD